MSEKRDESIGGDTGGCGGGRNKLVMPVLTTPGYIPRKGVSKAMSPRTRCRNKSPEGRSEGTSTTSAASMPPKLWPTRMMLVLLDS